MTQTDLRACPLGDSAITIYFGAEQSVELLDQIHHTAQALRSANIQYVVDVVPSYLAITVFYDSLKTTYAEMESRLLAACRAVDPGLKAGGVRQTHVIRVTYDGVDLAAVAEKTGLSIDRVVEIHSGREYRVDLLGFVPGFGYLSELDAALRIPRREQPRPRVKAGSVAIAAAQTAVYPLDTPGGWHILGRTDAVMFDPARPEPALLRAGDIVRFEPA